MPTRPVGVDTPSTSTTLIFLAAVIIGSANFVAVTFSNRELAPVWGAGLRFGLAGISFVLIAWLMKLPWPRGRSLIITCVYGLFTFTLSYALMYWALTQMSAGMGAVILATVPLVTPLLASAQGLEPLNRRSLLAALAALAAIVWMTVGADGLAIPLTAVVAALLASLTAGESVVLGKKISHNHPVMNNAVGMIVATPFLLALSALVGETWSLPERTDTILALVYLVTIGSVGLFVLILLVVRKWTAAASSYMFVLFPVGAMLFDAWLTDTPLTVRNVIGAVVVMASVWFGALAPNRTGMGAETTD